VSKVFDITLSITILMTNAIFRKYRKISAYMIALRRRWIAEKISIVRFIIIIIYL
jgi:hypothetical protein